MKHSISSTLILVLALVSGLCQAEPETDSDKNITEVIHLKHLFADEIYPVLSAFTHEDERISKIDNRIIVSASHSRITEINALVDAIDTPRKRWTLSIAEQAPSASKRSNGKHYRTRNPENVRTIQLTEGIPVALSRDRSSPMIYWAGRWNGEDALMIGSKRNSEQLYFRVLSSEQNIILDVARNPESLRDTTPINASQVNSTITRITTTPGEWSSVLSPGNSNEESDNQLTNRRLSSTRQSSQMGDLWVRLDTIQ